MKKLKLLTLLFLFTGIAKIAAAQIHIYTNTTWTDLSVTQDVIIHPGATLTIQDGGLQMAQGKYIHVMDRGQLKGVNGYITCADADFWKGIYLDQTPNASPAIAYGINFYNFKVENALIAISTGYGIDGDEPFGGFPSGEAGMHNRKIRAYNTVFQKNHADILLHNNVVDMAELEGYTHSHIFLQKCEFKDNAARDGLYRMWPNHILFVKNLYVFNCTFTSDKADILMHLRGIVDSRLNSNTFSSDSKYYLSLHGQSKRVDVIDNFFDLHDSGKEFKVGLDIGHFMVSGVDEFNVSKNRFIGESSTYNSWGIGSKESGATHTNLSIRNNIFEKLKYGVRLGNLETANNIEENEFNSCYHALYFFLNNPEVKISCNKFSNCIRDILIADGATLQNQNFGYDPSNSFSPLMFLPPEPQYNIQNSGTANFYYHYKDIPPYIHPGTVNIILNYVNTKIRCQTDGGAYEVSRKTADKSAGLMDNNTVNLSVYPNPNNGVFSVSTSASGNNDYFISDATGRVIQNGQFQNKIEISLDNLPTGVYFLNVKNQTGNTMVEKIVIR